MVWDHEGFDPCCALANRYVDIEILSSRLGIQDEFSSHQRPLRGTWDTIVKLAQLIPKKELKMISKQPLTKDDISSVCYNSG